MTETEMYKVLHKEFKRKGYFSYHIDFARIPDVYVSRGETVFWVELKVVSSPFNIVPKWRPGQLSWIHEQKKTGSCDNVWLCVYIESTEEYRFYFQCKKKYTPDEPFTCMDHFIN